LLFVETVRTGRSKIMSPQYIGPYEVLAVEGGKCYDHKSLSIKTSVLRHMLITGNLKL